MADKIRDAAEARINASTRMTDDQKQAADKAFEAGDAKIHAWLEAHRAAPELSELCYLDKSWDIQMNKEVSKVYCPPSERGTGMIYL